MKSIKTASGLSAAGAVLLLAAPAHAQALDKLYLDVGLGPAITQDTAIRPPGVYSDGHMKFDTGIRGAVDVGYNLTPSFAAEFDTGVIWNGIRSIHDNVVSGGATADTYEVPVLANVVFKPFHGAFQPYIGGGFGVAATVFDLSDPNGVLVFFGKSFSATDWTYAYQAQAGFKYAFTDNVEAGLAYEFLGTGDHKWQDNGTQLKTAGFATHAIMATFTWRF
ncbi:MAG: outer membrane beta-barrel protein [Verrucomicrobiota bacterium]|nr:outer membrane beta-barrel protein [Verrucomicrobiota bacterium]